MGHRETSGRRRIRRKLRSNCPRSSSKAPGEELFPGSSPFSVRGLLQEALPSAPRPSSTSSRRVSQTLLIRGISSMSPVRPHRLSFGM